MYLETGTMGTEVAQLQRDLNFCAYDAGPVDGDFGSQTQEAVLALQAYHGLEKDGIYGDQSDAALMGEIRLIQQALVNDGYQIAVDGAAGPETLAAITDFQAKNGLVVDGIVGNETMAKLGLKESVITTQPVHPNPGSAAAPSGNLSGKIICINPGHGGSDPGACGDLRESDMNLTVALRLGQLLAERGAKVIYTRTSDVRVPLSDRPVIANNAGADLFISIHHNGSNDPNASGTCAICYPGSENGYRLATLCLVGLYHRLGLRQRGLIQRDDSDVTYSDMPAVITEASFASSPADCAFFQNGGAELEALGILDGILAYFG